MNYDFKDENTGEIFSLSMKISELDEYLENNPHIKRFHSFKGHHAAFISPEMLGRKKAPEDFRNFLTSMRKANPTGYIQDH